MSLEIVCADIIAKRRRIWEKRRDIEYDASLVKAAVRKILSTPSLAEEIRKKPYLLIEIAFCVVDKERNTTPFFLNEVQRHFVETIEKEGTKRPFFVLKGRQQGFTTLITAMQLSYAIVSKNFAGFTMADRADNTRAIFNDKARMVYERLPDELKPHERFNSTNELFFDKLNSSWRVATATDQVGRSRTLVFVHFSEVAFYECDLSSLQAGIGEAIAKGAIQIYETTANGFNQAKELWDSKSCVNLFYEWWRTPEYRSTEYEYIDKADAWLAKRLDLLREKGLDREQLAWYAKKYSGYLDKNTIKQEYPITPEEAFIASGDCVFDREIIVNRLVSIGENSAGRRGVFVYEKVTDPILSEEDKSILGYNESIQNIRFEERADGYIILHAEPEVKRGDHNVVTHRKPYVLGGDTAGSGADYFAAKVIDNITGHTVATLHKQKMDDDLYAEQCFCLGWYYNDALIGIETNYSRVPMRKLEAYGYPNLYRRERIDRASNATETVFGFETTAKTRPVIIGGLVEVMRDAPESEVDVATLKEMLVFVKKDNGRQEAVAGEHDDLVISLAITHFIRGQQSYTWEEVEIENEHFIEDNFSTEEIEGNGAYMSWEDF